MRFKWKYDKTDPDELILHDLDKASRRESNLVGWVRQIAANPSTYEIAANPSTYITLFVWVDFDEREDIPYNTKREAMRALRIAYRMHIIGGRKT